MTEPLKGNKVCLGAEPWVVQGLARPGMVWWGKGRRPGLGSLLGGGRGIEGV